MNKLVLVLCVMAIGSLARSENPGSAVKVAAIQAYSRLAATESNTVLLARLVGQAASNGARIVVLPECAVTGYMDPARDEVWSTNPASRLAAATWAEPVPGPSTRLFGGIASNLSIYLCMSLAEKDDGRFYNAQVLLNPRGEIIAHHRKQNLWPPRDSSWASEGNRPVQVVDTEFGRIGLMICYDVHKLARDLAESNATIVLYSIGWYGPNTEAWFRNVFTARYVRPNHFAVVGANWAGTSQDESWPGQGFSFVADRDGRIIAMASGGAGPEIVYAELNLAPSNE